MHNDRPFISVIMPAYNAERFIGRAVSSVINQTYTNWELIIIDDCSADNTVAVASRIAEGDRRISVVLNEKNMGVAKTRNKGLDMAKGDWIALLDSDDIWMPEKLEKQLNLAREEKADILYCSYGIVDENGDKAKSDYITRENVTFDDMLNENYIGCSTVMISRKAAENRFLTDFYHEDYVMWLTLIRQGFRACGLTEVLVKWRYIENSRSYNKIQSAKNRWLIYRKQLKLPLLKSIRHLARYAFAGIRKYKSE